MKSSRFKIFGSWIRPSWLRRGELLLISILSASLAFAQSGNNQELPGFPVPGYIQQKEQQRQGLESKVPGLIQNQTKDPPYYGGSNSILPEFKKDRAVHLGKHFNECYDLHILGSCGPTCKLIYYWWPVQSVQSGNFSQNPYALPQLYSSTNPKIEAEAWYDKVPDYAAKAVKRMLEWTTAPVIQPPPENPRIKQNFPDKKQRFRDAPAAGVNQREYHLVSTIFQMLEAKHYGNSSINGTWSKYSQQPVLKSLVGTKPLLACHAPKIPTEWFSDTPGMIDPSRSAQVNDAIFPSQMAKFKKDPGMCVRANVQGAHTPSSYLSLVDMLGSGSTPPQNMCVPGWGALFPVTSFTPQTYNVIVGGINLFKAISISFAVDPITHFNYVWGLDKIQWTYPRGIADEACVQPGGFGPELLGDKQDDQQARVTHWKFFICCCCLPFCKVLV